MHEKGFQTVELLVSLALILLAVAVLWLLFPDIKSEIAAAWIQAIGSIVALFGAIWIASRQHQQSIRIARAAVRDRHLVNVRMLMALAANVVRFYEFMESEGNNLQDDAERYANLVTIQNWAMQTGSMLDVIPVFDLPYSDMLTDVALLRQMVGALLIQVDISGSETTVAKNIVADPKGFFGGFLETLRLILYNFTQAEKCLLQGTNFSPVRKIPAGSQA